MTASSASILELQNVSLSFKARKMGFSHGIHHVLNGVSLQLFEGETLGIIGKNGCGKSSILRLMAGIIPPTSGIVRKSEGVSSALLSIGLGFRADLTGRDNATFSAMLQGATLLESQSYLEEIKEFSELGDSFEEPVKTYSSGMRSRLGFTTALVTHVDILLVDEVLSVGDAHFKHKAEKAMKDRITGNKTVVFVSHSDKQIENLCDRAIWLNEGKIAAEGDTSTVVKDYRGFIKKMNQKS